MAGRSMTELSARRCALTQLLCLTLLLGAGAIVGVVGGVLVFCSADLFTAILSKALTLSPDSSSFPIWRDTPIPVHLDIYLFNWTNPEELKSEGVKPILEECGPYRFIETQEKVAIQWNENSTVTYQQVRRWFFDEINSNGSLSDMITTVNVVALTATHVSRNRNFMVRKFLSNFMSFNRERAWVTRSVAQLLFDGYRSVLIDVAASVPALANANIPYDKFGWFYSRNGSSEYDGVFNMATGADDLQRLGELCRWNHEERTSMYSGDCATVAGSAGSFWPPSQQRSHIEMFSADLCRTIRLEYSEDVNVRGVRGYRYVGGVKLVDNGTLDAANECFCDGECLPAGVLNVSACRLGAPAFVSYPHFLDADASYLSAVDGLQPDPDKHRFYITLEPKTGIPLDVAARFQINVKIESYRFSNEFSGVERVLLPALWFEERATMTPELARSLSLLLLLPDVCRGVGAVCCCAGVCMALLGLRLLHRRRLLCPRRSPAPPAPEALKESVTPLLPIKYPVV